MVEYYPSEIHRLLKLGGDETTSPFSGAPEGLPVEHEHEHEPVDIMPSTHEGAATMDSVSTIVLPRFKFKNLLIYPAVFVIAFVIFFAILNFPSLMAQVQGFFSKPQEQQILGDNTAEYYKWISNYYYAVSDSKLLDPTNDIDKDGLSNQDEFIMKTNPTVVDSDDDGFSDGIEVMNSMNPWGEGTMTKTQRELAGKLDLIMINNRISYNATPNQGVIAGGAVVGVNKLNFDLNKPGQISIPRLNLQVPLIWSKDPADFENDLTHGVIHYPGTSLPDEQGIVYVSGHSSDYLWKKDPFHNVFAKINYLKPGDDIFIDVYGIDGKVYNYRYQVTGSAQYKPDDQTQFIDNSGSKKLNLSTCWPIGTSTNRLVVTAVQVAL